MMIKKGQVWIETVIYTLIGLALIGLVLAIVTPKIGEAKDKIVVEQTIKSLSDFDSKMVAALDWGSGNTRIVDFTMRQGELYINSSGDKIVFVLSDLGKPYSQPGVPIKQVPVTIVSELGQKSSSVSITLDYTNIADLTYSKREMFKEFSSAATPYTFFITNRGDLNKDDTDYTVTLDIVEGAA